MHKNQLKKFASQNIFRILVWLIYQPTMRRSGRVVECTGLENRRGSNVTGGSNPLSSAIKKTEICFQAYLCFLVCISVFINLRLVLLYKT